MDAWLQSADFSTRDLDLDAEGAVRTLASHDWLAETAWAKRLEAEGKEACQAGLGLNRADAALLHVCPDGVSAVVHWHRQVRVLGVLWHRLQIEMYEGVAMSRAQSAIRAFYAEDDAAVEQALEHAS